MMQCYVCKISMYAESQYMLGLLGYANAWSMDCAKYGWALVGLSVSAGKVMHEVMHAMHVGLQLGIWIFIGIFVSNERSASKG